MARLITLPPSVRNAQPLAAKLRACGFFVLSEPTWSDAADLAELLLERPPTVSQRRWLGHAHLELLEAMS